MIRLEGVGKSFGAVEALEPLDLEIAGGEWLGVFGRNGSGKTSLLRILVGLSTPSQGRLLIEGKEPSAKTWLAFRRRLGFMPERVAFHENLTGEKTLRYYAQLKGVDPREVEPTLDLVGLAAAAGRRLAGYSKGMLQRLNLAQALLGDPDILVMDEPLEGLDPHGVRSFFSLLGERDAGRTVIISSHQLPRVADSVHRICVLSHGKLEALGSESELKRSLDLPMRVTVYPSAESNGLLEESLRRLGAVRVVRDERAVRMEVPQGVKMSFLHQIQSLAREIDDLRVEEPSIEEVFLETE